MNTPNTCPTCNGTGVDNGVVCKTCYGERTLPIENLLAMAFKDTIEKIDDVMDRCNDIMNKCNDILEAIQNP